MRVLVLSHHDVLAALSPQACADAMADASAITQIRTAAVTAVATGALARPGARALAILGAATQAQGLGTEVGL